MPENYKHLIIEKEVLINPRRTKKPPPRYNPDDLCKHAQALSSNLNIAAKIARQQQTSAQGKFVFKLQYAGGPDVKNLYKHGVDFISQEDKDICIVFTDEKGLAIFSEHLSQLGLDDTGLTYKQILQAIQGIDNWTADDRKSWAFQNKGLPETVNLRLDIELWPIETMHHPKRIQLIDEFEHWIAENKFIKVDSINQDSLLIYRLALTKQHVELLLNHRDVRMVDLLPESGIGYQQLNYDLDNIPQNLASPQPDSARVCILDSGINTNHPLIKTAMAESKSFIEGRDDDDESGHGTAVAGIALYGDLEACADSRYWLPQFWLYNGKVMYRDEQTDETRFDEKIIETTLTKAVEYFAGECGCRIFNISLGNANAPFDGKHIGGIAYVLDRLAREYDILFIVSAGNFSGSDIPPVPVTSWRDEYPEYLMDDANVIIDPATALNAITVGSLAKHNQHTDEQRYPEISALSPANEDQPSPFTRHGFSIGKALKPDLVAPGGNRASPLRQPDRQWNPDERGMGVLTLNHQFVGGTLFKEIAGTSFAAPYITHLAGRLLNEYPQASANLLRAMLVNHANLPDACTNTFSKDWQNIYKDATGTKNRELAREVAGYGKIDEDSLYRSSETVVVLMAEDSIENNIHQFYELPLPENFLRTSRASRELRVTLAYSPVVRTTRLEYTATKMSFRLIKGKSLEEVQLHFNHETQNENETRNDDATPNRNISAQIRDKGTVQSSSWYFKQRKPDEKWFVVVTRQDRDWGDSSPCLDQEHYALVITATDRENEQAQLYTEIQLRIQEHVRARVT